MIDNGVHKKNVLCLHPTGYGKSLLFVFSNLPSTYTRFSKCFADPDAREMIA
jgi:superfamily II DNA/RNA helicase